MAPTLATIVLVVLTTFTIRALTLPLEPLPGKSGEDQVKEAVHKAELAARKAALASEKSGHGAELRVAAIKAKLAAQHIIKQHAQELKRLHPKIKSLRKWGHVGHLNNHIKTSTNSYPDHYSPLFHHRFRRPKHRNSFSHMINLNDLASDTATQNNYQEDTTLEDRLALEAEEDKKYGALSDNNEYSSSRSAFINQDATQSIQNQVASESARELKEIQQQINAESQNSLGKTTMGQAGAMFQGNPSSHSRGPEKLQARNGMMDVQTDLNSALSNAEGMNTDTNIVSPQLSSNSENDAVGANAFTGLGEEKPEVGMNIPGISSMANEEVNEQMGQGQASMEGPQGDNAQSALSALAAGAGAGQTLFSNSGPEISNDIGGLGGPGGLGGQGGPTANMVNDVQGGANGPSLSENRLGGGEMIGGESLQGNGLEVGSMKKSKINQGRQNPKRQ